MAEYVWSAAWLQEERTLWWDSSTLPDDAARQKQVETYRLLFEKMLHNMNKLSEDRTLTPEDMQAPVNF